MKTRLWEKSIRVQKLSKSNRKKLRILHDTNTAAKEKRNKYMVTVVLLRFNHLTEYFPV